MITITLFLNFQGESRQIQLQNRLTIGRGEAADVRLNDETVSRIHAAILRQRDQAWVVDIESDSGTFINGKLVPCAGTPLRDGDEIRLGKRATLRVRMPRAAAEKKTVPKRDTKHLATVPIVAVTMLVSLLMGVFAIHRFWPGEQANSGQSVKITKPRFPSPSDSVSQPPDNSSPSTVRSKLYLQMDAAEQREFVKSTAQRISLMMSNGKQPYEFTESALDLIEKDVRRYADRINSKCYGNCRVGNCSQRELDARCTDCLWKENLQTLYARASCYAPMIIHAFDDPQHKAPRVIGLYIPMIETEYHNGLCSDAKACGMFQFLASTATDNGVRPEDRDKPQIMAPAAALYISRRMGKFGTGPMSAALSVAGYNRGPGSVEQDLFTISKTPDSERSFWALAANSNKLDKFFKGENIKYVPKFFAAAIVGENPREFGLQLRPLSTYTD